MAHLAAESPSMKATFAPRAARGFLLALLAGLVFQCLNVTIKAMVLELPPMQAAWLRWITGILCIAPFALAGGAAAIHTRELRLHGLRSLFHAGGYALWYSGVGLIPLATTAALSFTGPLFVTLGAALFLGERVRAARWLGVVAGFAGVLVILRPGLVEMNVGSLLILASVPLIAGSNLVAKVVAGRDTPVQVVFWQSVLAAILFAPAGLWTWQEPGAWQLLLAVLAGFFGTLGYFLMTWAFRLLDISALQPLAFLGIVWASLFDLAVFGRTADAWTFVGAAIVVAAGTAVVHREGRASRSEPGARA
jgi:drug/metabolite transporter (DMT)-like permease